MFKHGRCLRLMAVAALLATSACSNSQAARPDKDDDRFLDLKGSAAPLLLPEGRTVSLENFDAAGVSEGMARVPAVLSADSPLGSLIMGCRIEGMVRSKDPIPAPSDAKCKSLTSAYGNIGDYASNFSAVDTSLSLACAGHWALTIAAGVRSTYVMTYGNFGIGVTQDPTKLPGVADTMKLYPAVRIPVPTPSDAATWALIAADLFRESAILSSRLLDSDQCSQADLNKPITTAEGKVISLQESVAATLSDSMTSMVEAAEKAQQLVAAAGEAKLATSADRQTALKEAWRGRQDSKLQAASIFVPVQEHRYEARQAVALWSMSNAAGNQIATTAPQAAPAGYSSGGVLGWVYPIDVTQPGAGYRKLVTYKKGSLYITSGDTPGSGELSGATPYREEGWVGGATTVTETTITYGQYKCGDGSVARPYYYVWSVTPVSGCTVKGDSNRASTEAFQIPHNSSWKYPVVLASLDTDGSKRAEQLLRRYAIDPRLSGTRLVSDVADDLWYAFRGAYTGAYAEVNGGGGMLGKLGITPTELERACSYIVQVAAVMGQPIVTKSTRVLPASDPNLIGQPETVSGIQRGTEPTHPATIYARLSRMNLPAQSDPGYISLTGTNVLPGPSYARSSVISTLDYVRWILTLPATNVFDEGRFSEAKNYTEDTLKMLKTSLGWAEGYLGARVRATFTVAAATPADEVDTITLVIDGHDYSDIATARQELELWSGTAGLEYGLRGSIGGGSYDITKLQLSDLGTWKTGMSLGAPTDTDLARQNALIITIPKAEAPGGVLGIATLITLVRNRGGAKTVLTSLYPSRPSTALTNLSNTVWLTPYGDYTAKVMSDGLAVNPSEPSKGALSCAGIPTDVKVKLEDELTEAVDGQDGIESSFVHALKRARAAADHADSLGDQLVTAGLEMDERVERARGDLEDLCGGVIDVERLEEFACSGSYNCDLGKLLAVADPAVAVPDTQIRGDLESLRRCLGIGDPPVNAVLGDKAACIRTATDSSGKVSPPGVCPNDDAACLNAHLLTDEPCGSSQATASGLTLNYVPLFPLNLKVANKDFTHGSAQPDPTSFGCYNSMALGQFLGAGYISGRGGKTWTPDAEHESLEWVTQASLQNLANAVGFDVDEYGFPTVTAGGQPFITMGSASAGPATGWAWPCGRHMWATSGLEGSDPKAVQACDEGSRSLFCGGLCGTANATDYARARKQTGPSRRRLYEAVLALKGISSASFRGVTRVETEQFPYGLPLQAGSVAVGNLPSWHPESPGGYAYKSSDSQTWCWAGAQWMCKTRVPLTQTPSLRITESWFGGYPADTWFAWIPGASGSLDVAGAGVGHHSVAQYDTAQIRDENINAMGRFLRGEASAVDLRFNACAAIPPELTRAWAEHTVAPGQWTTGVDMTEAQVRATWPQVESASQQAFTAGEISVLDCMIQKVQDQYSNPTPYLERDYTTVVRFLDEVDTSWSNQGCTGATSREFMVKLVAKALVTYDCGDSKPLIGSLIPDRVVLDALDLACAVKDRGVVGCNTLLDTPFETGGASDFPTLSRFVECAADRVEGSLENMVVVGIPKGAATDIAAGGIVNVFPSNRGEFGTEVAGLAGELVTMRQHTSSVVQAMRDLQQAMTFSQVELETLDLNRSIADVEAYKSTLDQKILVKEAAIDHVRFLQAVSSNVMGCLAATSKAMGNWVKTVTLQFGGEAGAAGFTCIDSGVQIWAETRINGLEASERDIKSEQIAATLKQIRLGQQVTDQEKRKVYLGVAGSVTDAMDRINTALIALEASHVAVQGHLAQIDQARNQAMRLASQVLMLGGDGVGRQYAVNTAMRSRMNTLRIRYERARDEAIGAAYLARRAIEQKVGVDMSLMEDDMTVVPAPKSWVDKLCTLSGIDYARIRAGGKLAATGSTPEAGEISEEHVPADYDYADGYIGDFVTKLEDFVESYRIDFPFQAADALAVVSLRDEILNVRRTDSACPAIEGPNLLYYTNGEASSIDAVDPLTAWETPCGANQLAALAAAGGTLASGPFDCAVPLTGPEATIAEPHCAKAAGRAQTMTYTACRSISSAEAVGDLRTVEDGLHARLEGASCTGANATTCPDLAAPAGLSGPVRAATGLVVPTITSAAAGIGKRKSIQAVGGQGLAFTSSLSAPATSYTVTTVAQLTGSATGSSVFTLWSTPTAEGALTGTLTLGLQNVSGVLKALVKHEPSSGTVVSQTASLVGVGPWILSLRVDSERDTFQLFVNGSLTLNATAVAMQASLLHSNLAVSVPAGNASNLKVATLSVFDRQLSHGELAFYHGTLGGTYRIATPAWTPLTSAVPMIRQYVLLEAGTHMLSWYEYQGANTTRTASVSLSDGSSAIPFTMAMNGTELVRVTDKVDPRIVSGWARVFGTFELATETEVEVGFGGYSGLTYSGLQLERVAAQSSYLPSPYFPTGVELTAERSSCEDSYGDTFRTAKYWRYDCEYFCPPGTGLECGTDGDPSGLPKSCFYETRFPLNLENIEKGSQIQQAGFAKGNFNYRFADLAVNVVGTAVKNCELSDQPTTCYANSNILYSLRHDEPFRVRNYDGDEYDAALFPGNIQQAQALLAERYLTNPLSSADRNLLSDYWHGELTGRPLDGNFRLRIYETDGLDWSAIEDVQVALRYHYWTREQ